MIRIRCPRCHLEASKPAPFCAACGAPLVLGDEAAQGQLDAPLEIDRRGRGGAVAVSLGGGSALPVPGAPAHEVHVQRAEPWRRAVAWALDLAPFAIGGGALARKLLREAAAALPAPAAGLDGFLDLLARERAIALSVGAAIALALAVYATLAHTLAGATLGKRLLGLRVIGPDGASPSPARSAARSALALASAALLGLGFVLALFTRSGRALHDLFARTWVVKAP